MEKLHVPALILVAALAAPEIARADAIQVDTTRKFAPDAKQVTFDYTVSWLPKQTIPRIRQEGTVNGIPYVFYLDSSGRFEGLKPEGYAALMSWERYRIDDITDWEVSCKTDSMTGHRSCFVRNFLLHVSVDQQGVTSISVGKDHYPGSQVMIRFGNKRIMTAGEPGFVGAPARAIFDTLLSAPSVKLRYLERPYNEARDIELSLSGFREAYEYCRWVLNGQPDRGFGRGDSIQDAAARLLATD